MLCLDTKKGVLYRLGNLPQSHLSEGKDPDSEQVPVPKEVPSSVPADAQPENIEEGDAKEESQIAAETLETEESIPDDKHEIATAEAPPELIALGSAPRENIVT